MYWVNLYFEFEKKKEAPGVFCKGVMVFCARASFLIVTLSNLIKKETLAHVFSCKFWEIFKNTIFMEHPWWLLLKKIESRCSHLFKW